MYGVDRCIRHAPGSIELIRAAVELGMTHFDIAAAYGPYANEELVCQVLAAPTSVPHRRAVSELGVILSA
jgi:aryl-alcohol dehydrogenase-like predicted oxidoreductase